MINQRKSRFHPSGMKIKHSNFKNTWSQYFNHEKKVKRSKIGLHLLEKLVMRYWGLLLFLLLCYWAYEKTAEKFQKEYSILYNRLLELQEEKRQAQVLHENLKLQINSQSDQDWIELTLMKGLGLVPEGYQKVYFKK